MPGAIKVSWGIRLMKRHVERVRHAAKKHVHFFQQWLDRNPNAFTAVVAVLGIVLLAYAFSAFPKTGAQPGLDSSAFASVTVAPIAPEAPAPSPRPKFVSSQEFEVKVFLAKKYAPSICFGKPSAPSGDEISEYLSSKPEGMADEVKNRFGASTDFQAYERLKQLDATVLQRTSLSAFLYQVDDGQCCTIARRTGAISLAKGLQDQPNGVQEIAVPC